MQSRLVHAALFLMLLAGACSGAEAPRPDSAEREPSPSASSSRPYPYPTPVPLPKARKLSLPAAGEQELIAVETDPTEAAENANSTSILLLNPESGRRVGSIPSAPDILLTPLAWSPDRRQLAYNAGACDGPCSMNYLRVADLADGSDRELAAHGSVNLTAVWVDDAHLIAGLGSQVSLVQVENGRTEGILGGHAEALGLDRNAEGEVAVALRPDREGSEPPPMSERTSSLEIVEPISTRVKREVFASNVTGTLAEKVRSRWLRSPKGIDHCRSPVFFPNGKSAGVVCVSDPEKSASTAWKVDLTSGNWRRLMTSESIAPVGHIRSLHPDPQGDRLLVQWSSECEVPVIYGAGPDGERPAPLFPEGAKFGSFSPDGTRLAFSSFDCGGRRTVKTSKLDGTDVRELHPGTNPVWSS